MLQHQFAVPPVSTPVCNIADRAGVLFFADPAHAQYRQLKNLELDRGQRATINGVAAEQTVGGHCGLFKARGDRAGDVMAILGAVANGVNVRVGRLHPLVHHNAVVDAQTRVAGELNVRPDPGDNDKCVAFHLRAVREQHAADHPVALNAADVPAREHLNAEGEDVLVQQRRRGSVELATHEALLVVHDPNRNIEAVKRPRDFKAEHAAAPDQGAPTLRAPSQQHMGIDQVMEDLYAREVEVRNCRNTRLCTGGQDQRGIGLFTARRINNGASVPINRPDPPVVVQGDLTASGRTQRIIHFLPTDLTGKQTRKTRPVIRPQLVPV